MSNYIDGLLSNFTINGVNALDKKEYISVIIGDYRVYQSGFGVDVMHNYELVSGFIKDNALIQYYNSCDSKVYDYRTTFISRN